MNTSRPKYYQLKDINREDYFVRYAIRGPMVVPSYGLQQDMPIQGPLSNSPVSQPSSINAPMYEIDNPEQSSCGA